MEDAVSHSSLDSSSTGDEYVLVHADPKLRITGDINDINQEICAENHSKNRFSVGKSMSDNLVERDIGHVIPSSQSADVLNTNVSASNGSEAGASSVSLPTSPTGDCVVFHGVTYLGCATVNAPRSEVEIYRNMAVLNEQSREAIPIVLSVPATADGTVRLLDPGTDVEISNYKIHRILFCARGPLDSNERRCFAFTFSHGESADSAIFQCHVFRCDLPEAVAKILYCFANTFRRAPKNRSPPVKPVMDCKQDFVFTVNLEFKEDDGKGGFVMCPRDKNVFKLRCNLDKRIGISVQQTGSKELNIERCFGLLVSPGRNVKHSDMNLIEMTSMGYVGEEGMYCITGHWDPSEQCFEILNTETTRDSGVFMTVAIDLVIHGIQEPVRFAMETKAKIFPHTEKFWYLMSKPHTELFHLNLTQVESANGTISHEVVNVISQSTIDRQKAGMVLPLGENKFMSSPDTQSLQEGQDEASDSDEPLLSGSGVVSKEITDENLLEAWKECLKKWHQNLAQKPKQVNHLCRKGIPEALRGEVWQLLVGCQNNNHDLLEAYRILITKDSPCEAVIQRDINRTFPAHDFFKENGGLGQESLFKISKAYSVYDEEIGYCQGQSFLAAALLLHMPEEQAFSVLVKIMFEYGLRDFFRNDFSVLHIHFYQLERLLEDHLPDVYDHFQQMNLEAHMYASQWFLTLFTAKFPLSMVFHILDIFLSEGRNFIFNVALGLLKVSRKDLLPQDFEGVLKYFRVQLPKKFRSEEAITDLMQTAISLKVNSKKLKKYEKEYMAKKEQEHEDPIEQYERENKRLMEANMRLEQENDDMAHEFVESKLTLTRKLNISQDTCEDLTKELMHTKKKLNEIEEEKQRLETESQQVKEMCRRELERLETDNTRNTAIIADYKQICSQLSERLEKQQAATKSELEVIRSKVKSCKECFSLFDSSGKINVPEPKIDPSNLNPRILELERHVRELELELAQTKLALVESECKNQDLIHQLNSAVSEIQASKNTWFSKTLNSIKEAAITQKKDAVKETSRKNSSLKDKKEPPATELKRIDSLSSKEMPTLSESISKE